MHQIQRMKQMVERLNNAARAYYQENREIMPNIEYDRLYDELVLMEKKQVSFCPTALRFVLGMSF